MSISSVQFNRHLKHLWIIGDYSVVFTVALFGLPLVWKDWVFGSTYYKCLYISPHLNPLNNAFSEGFPTYVLQV